MASVALRQLHLGDAVDFLLTASPLVAGILAVSTLAAAAGREPSPPWPTLPLKPSDLSAHFLWSNRSPWYTALTHVLCHANEEHKLANLTTLLLTGSSVHAAMGPLGWWATIVGGALTAALDPLQWRAKQAQSWLNSWTYDMLPSFTPAVARAWTSSSGWTACGASAAVCAQCGAEAALCLEQFVTLVCSVRDADDELRKSLLLPIVTHGFMLSRAISYVLSEHRALSGGASLTIWHGAHLTGFWWGVSCYLIYAVLQRRWSHTSWSLRRQWRRGGLGQGHRLGGH